MKLICFPAILLTLSLLFSASIFGQTQAKNPLTAAVEGENSGVGRVKNQQSSEESVSELRKKIADAELDYKESLEASSGKIIPKKAAQGEIADQRSIQRWFIRTLQNRITLMEELASVKKRKEDLRREMSTWSGFAEKPPYSILLSDNIRDSIQSAKTRLDSALTSSTLALKLIEEERSSLASSETSIRQLSEKMESEKDKDSISKLMSKLELQKLKSRLAAARIINYEIRKAISDEEVSENRQMLDFLGKQLTLALSSVSFKKEDIDKVVSYLDAELERVLSETERAENEYPGLQKALDDVRAELKRARDGDAGVDGLSAKERKEKIDQLQELVETNLAVMETGAKRLEILRMISAGINMQKSVWEMRFSSYGVKDFKNLQDSYDKLKTYLERIGIFDEYFKRQLVMTANLVAEETNKLQNSHASAKDIENSEQRLKTYKQRDELYRRTLDNTEKIQRLLLRWKESLDFNRKTLSFKGRMQDLLSEMSSIGSKLWNFEIFSADDTITVDGQQITGRRSITVGKVAEVLLTLFIGYFVCCFIAYLAGKFLKRRFSIDEQLARSWLKFFLVLLLAVFSLMAAKIPLTVFAFAGGALAIGLGFGMQNILKNFISGIIILIEQPLRVGDVVEVAGTVGIVTGINLRSSLIRNSNGIEKFIPNSTLLENDVINWTHSNRHVRFNVKVGVAYGSSPEKVTEILLGIAREHGQIQKFPAPQALLEDFGDNTLDFLLNYWVEVLPETDIRQIASDIRLMIEKRLGEAGISIAFPQRDVHLDSAKPLKIELVSGEKTDIK